MVSNQDKPTKFPFSSEIKILFKTLLIQGDELRIVGGAVRDFLLKKPIKDFDFACKFLPDQTANILSKNNIKNLPTGLKYGTITALISGKQFQITTLRRDINNFGRDCDVEFTNDFREDAARRDFTINALSIDQNGEIYDYFNGIRDLKDQKVCFIGNSETRIKEDYLRILRFFRFSCFYASNINRPGLKATVKYKNHLKNLSRERIREELFKTFSCQDRRNLSEVLKVMFDKKILNVIFPNLRKSRFKSIQRLFDLENKFKTNFDVKVFLAILICNDKARIVLSNAEKKYINLISKPQIIPDFKASKKQITKLLLKYSHQELVDVYLINLVLSKNFEIYVDDFAKIMKIIPSIHIPPFPLNGHDLINLNISPKNIGKTLEIAKNYWWEKDFKIEKAEILSFIKKQSD